MIQNLLKSRYKFETLIMSKEYKIINIELESIQLYNILT